MFRGRVLGLLMGKSLTVYYFFSGENTLNVNWEINNHFRFLSYHRGRCFMKRSDNSVIFILCTGHLWEIIPLGRGGKTMCFVSQNSALIPKNKFWSPANSWNTSIGPSFLDSMPEVVGTQ